MFETKEIWNNKNEILFESKPFLKKHNEQLGKIMPKVWIEIKFLFGFLQYYKNMVYHIDSRVVNIRDCVIKSIKNRMDFD